MQQFNTNETDTVDGTLVSSATFIDIENGTCGRYFSGVGLLKSYYTVNRKNTPEYFCHIFHKTQSILIKFGTHCPE